MPRRHGPADSARALVHQPRAKGNTGSASPYIMLDELFRSGRIRPGHKLLMFVPESGRFSSGLIHLEAV